MVHELLDTIKNVSTEELERVACEKHILHNAYYFILRETGLEGPYTTKMEQNLYEWFRTRDFFSLWIFNDANKTIGGNTKSWLSSTYLAMCLKAKNSEDDVKKMVPAVSDAVKESNKFFEKIPEISIPFDEEKMLQRLEKLEAAYEEATLILKESLKKKLNQTIKIKIFYDAPEEEYIEEGHRYLYSHLFNKGEFSNVDGKIIGTSTFMFNNNSDKKYIQANETRYKKAFLLSLEELYRMYLYTKIIYKQKTKEGSVYVTYVKFDNSSLSDDNNEQTNGYKITYSLDGGECNIKDFSENIQRERENNFEMVNYVGFKSFSNPLNILAGINRYIIGMNPAKDKSGKNDWISSDDKTLRKWLDTYNDSIDEYMQNGYLSPVLKRELWNKAQRLLNAINPSDDDAYLQMMNIANTCLNIKYKGVETMRDVFDIKSDEDYFYAAGQLAYYLSSMADSQKTKNKNITTFIRKQNDKALKKYLALLMCKYENNIQQTKNYCNLVSVVFGYTPKKYLAEALIEGIFVKDNVVYKSQNNKEEV